MNAEHEHHPGPAPVAAQRAALAAVAHLGSGSRPDAATALRNAAEDGVPIEQVALVLAELLVARTRAAGIDVHLWTGMAMAACPDWEA